MSNSSKNTKRSLSAITNATLAVTYRCNAKCIMCNIWKDNVQDGLSPDDFLKLPRSLQDINLTGGEPFLRKDIVEISEKLTTLNPKVRLIFSSNGLLSDLIIGNMKEIIKINPRTGIGISIDGIGDVHSKVRGIENAFDKAMNTVDGLKKSGIKDIRLAFTASNENVEHLPKVYKLSQDLGVEFTMSVVHNSDNYFNIDSNLVPDPEILEKYLQEVINKELKFVNPRRLLRTYYLNGILEFIKNHKRPLPCYAVENSFFMDAKGDIFACNILEKSIGNIKDKTFEEIWTSDEAEKLSKFSNKCNQCWMVCTVKNSIVRNPYKVCSNVMLNKLKALGK